METCSGELVQPETMESTCQRYILPSLEHIVHTFENSGVLAELYMYLLKFHFQMVNHMKQIIKPLPKLR